MLRSPSWRGHVARLALGLALGTTALALPAPGAEGDAHAAVSILMTLDELVATSSRVVVAEPIERTSRWEELGGGRRIVTYTRLAIDETIAGGARSDVWVRTLGGSVDKIGQHVAGEATFTMGEKTLVFLEDVEGATVVTGMAQGHYRLAEADGDLVLKASPDSGTLLPRKGPSIAARELLVGARLERARTLVQGAWKQRGTRK